MNLQKCPPLEHPVARSVKALGFHSFGARAISWVLAGLGTVAGQDGTSPLFPFPFPLSLTSTPAFKLIPSCCRRLSSQMPRCAKSQRRKRFCNINLQVCDERKVTEIHSVRFSHYAFFDDCTKTRSFLLFIPIF